MPSSRMYRTLRPAMRASRPSALGLVVGLPFGILGIVLGPIAGAILLGIAFVASIGSAQWLVLRRYVHNASGGCWPMP